jgi:pyrroline-5-carboxylate reductase
MRRRRDKIPVWDRTVVMSKNLRSLDMQDLNIAFIGPGVMAEAMACRLVMGGLVENSQITMGGPRKDRLESLEVEYGYQTSTHNEEAVKGKDVVILAVKPQSLEQVIEDLRGELPAQSLVLSIIAGSPIRRLMEGLEHRIIVRAMPNSPVQVGEGITVWTATPDVSSQQIDITRRILSAFGEEIFVEDEDYLDMATAVSGTGPAYTFLFMEAMVDAGVHLGFPRRISEQLVIQTVKGAVAYYEHSPSHLARLRNEVTSPGGTSAAALYYLEKAGFRTAISRAIWAAYERSVQLGKGRKRGGIQAE